MQIGTSDAAVDYSDTFPPDEYAVWKVFSLARKYKYFKVYNTGDDFSGQRVINMHFAKHYLTKVDRFHCSTLELNQSKWHNKPHIELLFLRTHEVIFGQGEVVFQWKFRY